MINFRSIFPKSETFSTSFVYISDEGDKRGSDRKTERFALGIEITNYINLIKKE